MLHISKDEQKERLQARLDDPEKGWKFAPVISRRAAAGTSTWTRTAMLERCSTPDAVVCDPGGPEVVPQLGDLKHCAGIWN